MSRREIIRALVASSLFSAIVFALALAALPQLHSRLHPDAGSADHECAVTLIATGRYNQADAPLVLVAPRPAATFANIPVLAPVWVPAPFFGASVFEHAPPALS